MSKKSKPAELIPAVGYLRKSTSGVERSGRERQEKSLPQQKRETEQLAKGVYTIMDWYADPGVSGWKRHAQRPDFQRMMDRAREQGDFQAVLCDNIDRFSRASVDEVQEDALALKRAGVRWIVTAAQGTFDLGRSGHDIGEIMKFVVAVWSAHEYSRQLARRITLARRNRALEGKRTGGNAAYGLANDGKGGYRHGDKQEVKIVHWAFDEFANQARSMRSIVGDLNKRGIPAPRGGKWTVKTLSQLLRRRAYRGDFTFNARHGGRFFGIDGKGEVVEAADSNGSPGKLFVRAGKYKPLVNPTVFDKAQRRLDTLSKDRSRRKAEYALSGVLVCDHCGQKMYACKPHRDEPKIVYKCSSTSSHGKGACGAYTIREDAILPFILRLLGQEVADVKAMLSAPPEHLRNPREAQREQREQTERKRDALAQEIKVATWSLMRCNDARSRKDMDEALTVMRDELGRLDACLAEGEPTDNTYNREELAALTKWWDDFTARAVSVPVKGEITNALGPLVSHLHQDPLAGEAALLMSPRVVNEALRNLGAEVRLQWRTEEYTTSGGVLRKRHILVRGRFQLGQQKGKLPAVYLITSGPPESPPRAWPEIAIQSSRPSREGVDFR